MESVFFTIWRRGFWPGVNLRFFFQNVIFDSSATMMVGIPETICAYLA